MDITNCAFKSSIFDAVICIHVLEEIPNDLSAMKELHRVLKPGGWAFISVPIQLDKETYEDPAITLQEERMLAFGEAAHVRVYGLDLQQRLEKSGFDVSVDFGAEIPDQIQEDYGIKDDENIFFCQRL